MVSTQLHGRKMFYSKKRLTIVKKGVVPGNMFYSVKYMWFTIFGLCRGFVSSTSTEMLKTKLEHLPLKDLKNMRSSRAVKLKKKKSKKTQG